MNVENEKYRVTRTHGYIYGSENQAMIIAHENQIWELRNKPNATKDFFVISRDNVAIEITKDDFKTKFKRL